MIPAISGSDSSEADLDQAVRILHAGGLVAFPTETVYGLGGDATDDRAVAAIFAAKGRPRFNPLIAHVADLDAVEALVEVDDRARRAAAAFWPGPLTLVLPRRADSPLSLLCSAGLDSAAVRMPSHPLAQALLRACGRPLAAPSANPSGRVSPTTAAHVREGLGGKVPLVLDGGPCTVGLESTVLDLSGPVARILRPGSIGAAALCAALGAHVEGAGVSAADPATGAAAPKAPGMLSSHYAPGAPVLLDVPADAVAQGTLLLGFGPLPDGAAALNLSPAGDLREAAANLFAMLRALDARRPAAIAVSPVPDGPTPEGAALAEAIRDRLRRAAAPRPVMDPEPGGEPS